jgi:hypothetical protein
MKSCLAATVLAFFLASGIFAAGKGPEIDLVNNKLSISAEAITLGRLLRLLDLATGMQSKVPPELANRSLSVRFSSLSVDDGVRKIFEGQPFDYVVLQGRGVIVTGAAQSNSGPESVPVYNPGTQPQPFPQQAEQPFTPDFQAPGIQPGVPGQPQLPGIPGQPGQQGQQPAMIQTPFGPIANPRATQSIQQQGMPPAAPPQQNPLFPGQQQTSPVGGSPAPTPFGAPSPFGAPQTSPNNSNGMFGAPTVFGAPNGTRPQ